MEKPVIAIVVPCYNEEQVLPQTCLRLEALLSRLMVSNTVSPASRIWFVDDGSRDQTWALICAAASRVGALARGIKLSRNRGHQAALMAGLLTVEGDAVISIDADLQDDLEAIPQMLAAYASGIQIVYGVRSARDSDSGFKRFTAEAYYRILHRFGVEVVFNHADFRLMSRTAIEALRRYPESNVFLRGIIPQLGFRSTEVSYARTERLAGESKYPLRKMLALAWQGLTSFSTAPLRAITAFGMIVSLLSIATAAWALWVKLIGERAVPGWASTVIPLFFLSGVQLLALGIIGEYLAKVFIETKRRPLYIVEETTLRDEAAVDLQRNETGG